MPTLAEVQDVFFRSGREGWAAGVKALQFPMSFLPGAKVILWSDGPWQVADAYLTNSLSSRSFGIMSISYDGHPQWTMSYGGEYAEEAIPILKKALLAAYENNLFYGGRGALFYYRYYGEGALLYENRPKRNEFSLFDGREEIYDIETGGPAGLA